MENDPDNLEEVQHRLREIQQRKRGGIRWHVSRHTAEIAITALTAGERVRRPKSGKARRRKRSKRLL